MNDRNDKYMDMFRQARINALKEVALYLVAGVIVMLICVIGGAL